MEVKLKSGTVVENVYIYGGRENYDDAIRSYLEFVLLAENNTVENLESIFTSEECEDVEIINTDNAESFTHSGYIVLGPIRKFKDSDGVWKIGIKRYAQTDSERNAVQLSTLNEAYQEGVMSA